VRAASAGKAAADARALTGALGVLAVLLGWTALALTVLRNGGAVPTPAAVVRGWLSDGWRFYSPHVSTTLSEAGRGFVWGNLAAVAAASVVVLIPVTERVVLQLGIASFCLPVIALAPILAAVFKGTTSMAALAALSVFFTTLVGTLLGLRAADPLSMDLVRAYGGGRWQQLRRVQLMAALPGLFTSLKIAAPAAVLGAIIGEFLGGERGLGIAMVVAQQSLNVPRTWGLALASGAVAGLGYALLGLVGRMVTPWAAASTGRGNR